MWITVTLKILFLTTLIHGDRHEFEKIVTEVNGLNLSWKAKLVDNIDYNSDKDLFIRASGSLDNSSLIEQDFPSKGKKGRFLQQTLSSYLQTMSSGTIPTANKSKYPDELDLRLKNPRCRSLRMIRNQGSCASCWAFAAMNIMSDAYCIAFSTSNASAEKFFSPQDSLECCPTCYATAGRACDGGYLYQAFKHAKSDGIVTGDGYGSNTLCKPYFIPDDYTGTIVNPSCSKQCNPTAKKVYNNDKTKIQDFLFGKGEEQMIDALNRIGSIAVTMKVYQDLYTYESGVYARKYGRFIGGHAVKIIGYGVENKEPYWLVANSWGTSWGIRGFFKIRRGTDESGIESAYFFAALFK